MSSFIERILHRFNDSKYESRIKPALTPDSLPEKFPLSYENVRSPDISPESLDVQSRKIESSIGHIESEEQGSTSRVEALPQNMNHFKPVVSESENIDPTGNQGGDRAQSDIHRTEVGFEEPISNVVYDDAHKEKTEIKENATKDTMNLGTKQGGQIGDPVSSAIPFSSGSDQKPQIRSDKMPTLSNISQLAQMQSIPMNKKREPDSNSTQLEPSVTVNIGRIDVRAMMPDEPLPNTPMPKISLEEYLKRRREGRI